jgi:glycosyltransferase involved in cell wall biosynthesis
MNLAATRVLSDELSTESEERDGLQALRGRDILCFSHDWTGDPLSKTHLMRLLAKHGNRVLWVNSIGYRAPALTKSDLRRAFQKLASALKSDRLSEVEKNIFVLHPLAIPKYGSPLLRRLNRAFLSWQIRRAMQRLGFERPVNWVFNPAAAVVAGSLGEDLLIYHCVDEYTQFSGVDAEAIGSLEQQLLNSADLVLVSAQQLYDSKAKYNSNTHIVRHGVDVAHFRKATEEDTVVAEEIAALPRPVLGFFGLVADWVDIELLAQLADRFSEGSLVMLGKATTDISSLQNKSNVHLLGRRPYDELPRFCKGWDVALLPFRINELTLNANPLKAREYLAAGLPVVSTPIPEVEVLGLCRIARNVDEFEKEIRDALAEAGPSAARSDAVLGESWEQKLLEVDLFVAAMDRRQKQPR